MAYSLSLRRYQPHHFLPYLLSRLFVTTAPMNSSKPSAGKLPSKTSAIGKPKPTGPSSRVPIGQGSAKRRANRTGNVGGLRIRPLSVNSSNSAVARQGSSHPPQNNALLSSSQSLAAPTASEIDELTSFVAETAKQALRQCANEFNTSVLDFLSQVAIVAPEYRDKLDVARSEFESKLATNDMLFNLPAELSTQLLLPCLDTDPQTGQVTADCFTNPAVTKFIHNVSSLFGSSSQAVVWDVPAMWKSLPVELQTVILRYLTLFKSNLALYKQAKQQFGGTNTDNLGGMMGSIVERVTSLMSGLKLSDFSEMKSMEDVLANPKVRDLFSKMVTDVATPQSSSGDAAPPPNLDQLPDLFAMLGRGPLANLANGDEGTLGSLVQNILPTLISTISGVDGVPNSESDPYIDMLGNSSQVADFVQKFGTFFNKKPATPPPAPLALPDEALATPVTVAVAVTPPTTATPPPAASFDFSDCVSSVVRN